MKRRRRRALSKSKRNRTLPFFGTSGVSATHVTCQGPAINQPGCFRKMQDFFRHNVTRSSPPPTTCIIRLSVIKLLPLLPAQTARKQALGRLGLNLKKVLASTIPGCRGANNRRWPYRPEKPPASIMASQRCPRVSLVLSACFPISKAGQTFLVSLFCPAGDEILILPTYYTYVCMYEYCT